jgi:hypothetical protein
MGMGRMSTREHLTYVRNLLALLEYAPDLRGDVLPMVVERLLQLDVRCRPHRAGHREGTD